MLLPYQTDPPRSTLVPPLLRRSSLKVLRTAPFRSGSLRSLTPMEHQYTAPLPNCSGPLATPLRSSSKILLRSTPLPIPWSSHKLLRYKTAPFHTTPLPLPLRSNILLRSKTAPEQLLLRIKMPPLHIPANNTISTITIASCYDVTKPVVTRRDVERELFAPEQPLLQCSRV